MNYIPLFAYNKSCGKTVYSRSDSQSRQLCRGVCSMLAEILGLHPKISFHEFHNISCVVVFSVKFIQGLSCFVLFFGRRGRAIRTEVHARADDFSSMVSHFGNIDPSSSVFGSQLLAVSNAYRVTSPQTLRLCISYEISLYVLLPMTIQLSMSGQPSHPMKSLTSHKAPCRYELAHSKQFLVGEQLCKAQLTICTT